MSKPEMDLRSIRGSAKGLVKAVAIVDTVAGSPLRLRATDITAAVGLPHTTVMRLLDVLTHTGLLRGEADGGYELGPHVAAWGSAFQQSFDLARRAHDLLESLRDETQETVYLGVREGNSIRYVAHVPTPHAVRPAATVGASNPLHCTGIGKVLLAHLPAESRAPLIAGPLDRRTASTITDPAVLETHLAVIREQGFSIDNVENEEGVRCVAAPVRDHVGEVVAALSVSAPEYRLSLDDACALAPRVISIADELSVRTGYRPEFSIGRDVKHD